MRRGLEQLVVAAADWRSAPSRQVTAIPGEPVLEVPDAELSRAKAELEAA
jgi:hypothetical protein